MLYSHDVDATHTARLGTGRTCDGTAPVPCVCTTCWIGGPDDRLVLDFGVQLCANPGVCATVMRLMKCDIQANISAPEAVHIAVDNSKAEEYAQANMVMVTSLRSVCVFLATNNALHVYHTRN